MNPKQIAEIDLLLDLASKNDYTKLLFHFPDDYHLICNGVGSETSWTYKIIPNTIWGLNIYPSAGIHDFDFTYPIRFDTYADGMAHFHDSNKRFWQNMDIQITDASWIMRPVRRMRRDGYFYILENTRISQNSFWSNKPLPSDWFDHNCWEPSFNQEKYETNLKIQNKIKGF